MAYLTATEINTHLYGEVVDEIERHPTLTPLLDEAIKAAIAEAKSYLSAYDKSSIFDATGDDRNPILLLYTKDIAVWHYIQLANPDIDYDARETRYKMAIDWLGKVQSGKTVPELPVPTVENTTTGEGFIKFGSNPKRNNYYN